jgi:hypothetical protein
MAAVYGGVPSRKKKPRMRTTIPSEPPKLWIEPDVIPKLCTMSPEELKEAAEQMEKDLTHNKSPPKEDPHLIFTIGAPGSGKSTVARICATAMNVHPLDSYIELDFDTFVKYHPRLQGLWNLPSADGTPTGIGYAFAWQCTHALDPFVRVILNRIREKKFNIILQTHNQPDLIWFQRASYRCTLLYVAAPLELCQKRARERAIKTGMFLARTLAEQDVIVADMRALYKATTPWYALWVDDFVVVKNDDETRLPAPTDFQHVPAHGADSTGWTTNVNSLMDLVVKVTDK